MQQEQVPHSRYKRQHGMSREVQRDKWLWSDHSVWEGERWAYRSDQAWSVWGTSHTETPSSLLVYKLRVFNFWARLLEQKPIIGGQWPKCYKWYLPSISFPHPSTQQQDSFFSLRWSLPQECSSSLTKIRVVTLVGHSPLLVPRKICKSFRGVILGSLGLSGYQEPSVGDPSFQENLGLGNKCIWLQLISIFGRQIWGTFSKEQWLDSVHV